MTWTATEDDVPEIIDMIEALREAVAGPVPVDRAHTEWTLLVLIANPNALVLRSTGGFIAGEINHLIISPAMVARELGWYANDGQGMRLLDQWLSWAREKGATGFQLSTAPDCAPSLSRALKRRGFFPAEIGWAG